MYTEIYSLCTKLNNGDFMSKYEELSNDFDSLSLAFRSKNDTYEHLLKAICNAYRLGPDYPEIYQNRLYKVKEIMNPKFQKFNSTIFELYSDGVDIMKTGESGNFAQRRDAWVEQVLKKE